MDQRKRRLTFDQLSEEKIKRSKDESAHAINYIENFSSEFFYEIFDYLDGGEIHKSFSNLNHRFEQLLNCSSLLFTIKLHRSMEKEVILHYKHKIIPIRSSAFMYKSHLIPLFHIDSSFIHLESLVLASTESEIIHSLLPELIHLPHLLALTVDTWCHVKDLHEIYQMTFQLPKLKYLKFSAIELIQSKCSLPLALKNHINQIKYLVVDQSCTLNELSALISYTPQLHRLNFSI